ncbi:MAG: hypothetical protein ACI835_001315 [Planctomycetota bacterium]|jgi:hypothetical protein
MTPRRESSCGLSGTSPTSSAIRSRTDSICLQTGPTPDHGSQTTAAETLVLFGLSEEAVDVCLCVLPTLACCRKAAGVLVCGLRPVLDLKLARDDRHRIK